MIGKRREKEGEWRGVEGRDGRSEERRKVIRRTESDTFVAIGLDDLLCMFLVSPPSPLDLPLFHYLFQTEERLQ